MHARSVNSLDLEKEVGNPGAGVGNPGAGVTGTCELPDSSSGKSTQALCKGSSKGSSHRRHPLQAQQKIFSLTSLNNCSFLLRRGLSMLPWRPGSGYLQPEWSRTQMCTCFWLQIAGVKGMCQQSGLMANYFFLNDSHQIGTSGTFSRLFTPWAWDIDESIICGTHSNGRG